MSAQKELVTSGGDQRLQPTTRSKCRGGRGLGGVGLVGNRRPHRGDDGGDDGNLRNHSAAIVAALRSMFQLVVVGPVYVKSAC